MQKVACSLLFMAPPRCRGREHAAGVWRERRIIVDDEPPCCGEDMEMFRAEPLCGTRSQKGLSSSTQFWPRPQQLTHIGGCACTCDRLARSGNALDWHPSACELPSWNARTFCDALGQRILVFVGDSTMAQAAVATMNAVEWGTNSADRRSSSFNSSAGCAEQLKFGHSDTLVYGSLGRMSRGRPLNAVLAGFGVGTTQRRPIVVVSAGAHIIGDANFTLVLQRVNRTVSLARFGGVSFLWRTQNPTGCGAQALEALPPDPQSEESWERVLDAERSLANKGRHAENLKRDIEARRFFEGHPRVRILDLSPLYLRVDAHVASERTGGRPCHGSVRAGRKPLNDCMHWCAGPAGPLGKLVPRVLLNTLLQGG